MANHTRIRAGLTALVIFAGIMAMAAIRSGTPIVSSPSAAQSLAAGGTVSPTQRIARIVGNGGAVTLTSTPNISDGSYDGCEVIVQGTDDGNTVTLQDADTLPNSGLVLAGSANCTVGKGDILYLTYDANDDLWYEISRANN